MRILKTVFFAAIAAVLLGVGGAAAFVYSGTYNVAATARHWNVTVRVLETARIRSIKAHSAGITVPPDYDDPAKIASAAAHFSAHCAFCHGSPGVSPGDAAGGMYPRPPDLTNVSRRYTPAELFWIIKHGIKMSGMPSMADDGDNLLWATVGFLEKLPRMTPDDYNDLWMASQAQSGHQPVHMHGMHMPGMNMGGPTADPSSHDSGQPTQQAPGARRPPQ